MGLKAVLKAQPSVRLRPIGRESTSVGSARHMSAAATLSVALRDSPAFGKQQPGFGSREIKHVAWGVRSKIDTVDPLRELFD